MIGLDYFLRSHITAILIPSFNTHSFPLHQSILSMLHELFASDLKDLDAVIQSRCQSYVHLIPELSLHLMMAGGKRIRPLLTLLSYDLLKDQNAPDIRPQAIALGAAVEFIHCATLLHDDVIDKSTTRRGKPTANHVWGNSASILVGDFLFAQAFYLMLMADDRSVLGVLAKATAAIAEGEVFQLGMIHNVDMGFEACDKIMTAKTSSLFVAACEVGARLAKASEAMIHALKTYGHYLGLVFQIRDDVLDYIGLEETLGKHVGDDFFERKVTLPVLYAYQSQEPQDCSDAVFWQTHFQNHTNPSQDKAAFDKACRLMSQSGAFEKCYALCDEYALLAQEALLIVPESSFKQHLLAVIDYCKIRHH